MNQTISSETSKKAVNIKKIFDHNKLLMPNNNPNDNNIKSWKNFYRKVNNLKEGRCREDLSKIKPSTFAKA